MLACNKPKSNFILLRWREATTQNTSAFVVFYPSMFSFKILWHKQAMQGKWKKTAKQEAKGSKPKTANLVLRNTCIRYFLLLNTHVKELIFIVMVLQLGKSDYNANENKFYFHLHYSQISQKILIWWSRLSVNKRRQTGMSIIFNYQEQNTYLKKNSI